MAEGYEVYEGAGMPSTGMINAAEGGLIWKRPDGSVMKVTRQGFFPLTPEQAAPYLAPAPIPAAEQAEALGGVAPSPEGMTARDASQLQVKTRQGTSLVDKAEVQRANTEAAVQNAMARERAAQTGPLGGLSIGERARAAELIRTGKAKDEEEATKMILASRPAAGEQAEALGP